MIHIKVKKEQNVVTKVTLLGHALYDDYGKDIVCAGVSAILTTTINGILRFDEKSLVYRQMKDAFVLNVNKKDEITQKLIENMICLFEELVCSYPKNIKMESED